MVFSCDEVNRFKEKASRKTKDSGASRAQDGGSCGTDCHCLVLLAKVSGFVSGSG
jgi:hypothetical protein